MKVIILDGRITPESLQPKSPGSAGIDLVSTEDIEFFPGDCFRVKTGLKVWIGNYNIVGLISLRSGFNDCFSIPNTPGIIDADYQGELIVKLRFDGIYPRTLNAMERFAQLTLVHKPNVAIEVVDCFHYATERSTNGFGSSGKD